MKITDILAEGPNDPQIFKAVFLAGGPGSGKSYVANKLLSGFGLKTINSDDIYEYLAKKNSIDLGDPDVVGSEQGQEIRNRAKQLTKSRRGIYLDGRLGVILDGTGKDVEKVAKDKKALEELGYECVMIMVNTDLEITKQRNQMRDRTVPEDMLVKMWQQVQSNIGKFQRVFGSSNFFVVDNTHGLDHPDVKDDVHMVAKELRHFLTRSPNSHIAKQWIASQKPGAENVGEAAQPDREVTQADLQKLEMYADKVFAKVGIDIEFTRHFLDRVNDERNIRQITLPELALLFRDEYAKWGKKIAQLGPDAQAVMKDMRSDINIPFALNWDPRNQELDLVAKTVMRKKNFKTPNKEFPVESKVNEDAGSMPDWQTILTVAAAAKMTPLAIKAMWKTAKGAYKIKKFADAAGIKLADKVIGK